MNKQLYRHLISPHELRLSTVCQYGTVQCHPDVTICTGEQEHAEVGWAEPWCRDSSASINGKVRREPPDGSDKEDVRLRSEIFPNEGKMGFCAADVHGVSEPKSSAELLPFTEHTYHAARERSAKFNLGAHIRDCSLHSICTSTCLRVGPYFQTLALTPPHLQAANKTIKWVYDTVQVFFLERACPGCIQRTSCEKYKHQRNYRHAGY